MIRFLEEIAVDAWPALRMELFDGWILRFADGYSRRSNSVYPLYPSTIEPREKILACERIYGENGLRTVFKMTTAVEPRGLDDMLAGEGYRMEAPTSVQLLDLDGRHETQPSGARFRDESLEDWIRTAYALSKPEEKHQATFRKILEWIRPPRIFASVESGGRIAACGLGMIRRGYLCLYDILVDEHLRRQGFGRKIMEGLLQWGRGQGARHACLQVMEDNSPALALYARLGFQQVYRYWYRVKEKNTVSASGQEGFRIAGRGLEKASQ